MDKTTTVGSLTRYLSVIKIDQSIINIPQALRKFKEWTNNC